MAENKCIRKFWFFEENIIPFLLILSETVNYKLESEEISKIKYELTATSDERDIWFEYDFSGIGNINLRLAKDEENTQIIFVNLKTSTDLIEKIDLAIYIVENYNLNPINYND